MEYIEIFRMAERLIVTLFGGLSIYLGYRLLMSGVLKVGSSEWEGFGLRFKLTRVSPGIFFCVLGAIILLQSLHETVSLEKTKTLEPSLNPPAVISKTKFLGALNTRDWDRLIASVNTAIETLETAGLNESAHELVRLREMVLRSAFGDSDYEFYTKYEAGSIEELSGTDRAKWFTLNRRATKMTIEEGKIP